MGIRGKLYIRKLEIVDDADNIIYRIKNVSVRRGFQDALETIRQKDGKKAVFKIFLKFAKFLDDDFKKLFKLEE